MEATSSPPQVCCGGGGSDGGVRRDGVVSKSAKRLQFDRRYGWVFDEWRDPAEEALSGGRGMFCVATIAKGLVSVASHSITAVASTSTKILERPDLLSPQQLQASISEQFNRMMSSVKMPDLNMLVIFNNKTFSPPPSGPLHLDTESRDLQGSECAQV